MLSLIGSLIFIIIIQFFPSFVNVLFVDDGIRFLFTEARKINAMLHYFPYLLFNPDFTLLLLS